MYINFDYLLKHGIRQREFFLLQMCLQNKIEDNSEMLRALYPEDTVTPFIERGLLELVKGKKSDTIYQKLRISKKGRDLLDTAEIVDFQEEDGIVYEWLKSKYLELGKEVGSEKSGKALCAWFRGNSGIAKNNLVKLCSEFMADEAQIQYTIRLDYLFYKKSHVYQARPDLKDSRLWNYYEARREYFDKKFTEDGIKKGN